jgi:hypothetical protein
VETDSKFPTRLQELGDALDLAEACDADLRPRDMRSDRPGFATYTARSFQSEAYRYEHANYKTAEWEVLTSGAPWIVPQHRAVRAYWRELKAAMRKHVYVEDTLRRCRRRFKLASAVYEDLTIRRDSGYFIYDLPSLRSILDARAELIESHIILQQVEAATQYKNRVEAARRRKLANEIKLSQARVLIRQLKKAIRHD